MKISVIGLGYVGLSLSILLSQKYSVYAYDIDKEKIEKLKNNYPSSFKNEIKQLLNKKKFNINISSNKSECIVGSDFIIISVPTNYDPITNNFDTGILTQVIEETTMIEPKASIIIKSTVPFGFTKRIKKSIGKRDIYFSPEFLRESKALYDNLYPSRIIIGDKTDKSEMFANILKDTADSKEVKIIYMSSSEAEAVKLFSNTYLAMRVSFFNELDSFSEVKKLSSKKIISGVCLDTRIGNFYNNPSFGYGGYCLPKDTQQLLKNFNDIPNNIISGVVEANNTRKDFITQSILKQRPRTVGVYRLIMKSEADNFRESAIIDIIEKLIDKGIKIIVYEPLMNPKCKAPYKITHEIEYLEKSSDLIIANRFSKEIKHLKDKLYTRDIFEEN